MFEQTPEQMVAHIFVEDRESRLAYQYGVDIPSGGNTVSFASALGLIHQLDKAISSNPMYARNQKRLRALRNQILFAFGPDMEAAL